jgi:predicted nucleotidyltransferase
MADRILTDPLLKRFRDAVNATYGPRATRVVLFGSRARGDGRPDSDYDIAVFLRDMTDRFADMRRLADLGADILFDTGEVINALPYREDAYDDPVMPLMDEIRREGVQI